MPVPVLLSLDHSCRHLPGRGPVLAVLIATGTLLAAAPTAGYGDPGITDVEAQIAVANERLAPGDLVFYYADIHHVAHYVGNGSVIHAPSAGEYVRVQPMDYGPILGYGRPA